MGLNKEQQMAVDSNAERILCLASAGAGKTSVLISRISRLVQDGVDPKTILAITFTNNAAAEMKGRYEAANPGKEIPEFRTFHAFSYSILCKDPNIRTALGYFSVPEIASEAQEKAIKENAKTQCNITLSKDKLTFRENLSRDEQFQVELYDKAVKRLMRSENLITFDMLNAEVAELFASGHLATEPYKKQYKYISLDEAQDADAYQMKFLNSFTGSNFFVVGDCLQNLYSWRGTSNEFIKALAQSPDWEKIRLFVNYRSTNQICQYSNEFSRTYADDSYWIEMQGTRDGDIVITKRVQGPAKYCAIDLKDIDDVLHERESLSGTSAILCRSNKEVNAVINYLKELGVDYNSGKDDKLQNLIDCALSDSFALNWLSAYLSEDKYGEYIRLSSQIQNPDVNWFLSNYGMHPQIQEDVQVIAALRNIANSADTVSNKLTQVSELLHLKLDLNPPADIFGREFINYLKDNINVAKSSELYVGTIHSVKGLEYDNVFVMNVGSYSFRLVNEEMKNLFYVAITRAKNRLFVYKLFE